MADHHSIQAVRTIRAGQELTVGFVNPLLACVLAASRIGLGRDPLVTFRDDSSRYAEHSGLLSALKGDYAGMIRPRSGYEGQTWSHLTTLYTHGEIEGCNQTINDLLFTQLGGMPKAVLDHTARVVGELHDNVASHASGRGFSAAQYYQSGRSRLELAIVDHGRGFLRNVRQTMRAEMDDGAAIRWCLQKGNTTWRPRSHSPAEQTWGDPYMEALDRGESENHHKGWGLALLTELVRATHGRLRIWSGNGVYHLAENGADQIIPAEQVWDGVAIAVTLFPDQAEKVDLNPLSSRLTELAKELGL